MKTMFRHAKIPVAAFALSCLFSTFSHASEFRYLVPGNIVMTLEPVPVADASKVLSLVATVRAKVGVPKNLEIFFESTPDFKITPERTSVQQLATSPISTRLTVTKVENSASDEISESWVRMRVVYEPDYPSLAQVVDNPSIYPDPDERKRLTDRIMQNLQKRIRQTDALRYFPDRATSTN